MPLGTIDAIDVATPPIATIAYLGIGWVWIRFVNAGRPFNNIQRTMYTYSSAFVFGTLYVLMFGVRLSWPTPVITPIIVAWGFAVFFFARHRHVAKRSDNSA
jgi:hypothetical protein